MPVTYLHVRWSDQREVRYYSPSSIVTEHFEVGVVYALPEFVARARRALGEASERVARKYGYACSAAQDQSRAIERDARRFDGQPDASVEVLGFSR
ncbi:MSMEG_0570 family nitrogen starvation response protein [Cupriavidus sp. RAF12]|uniref:MSMEG_0570 family nitrogen starvation response protein n=1 Tax=Cupriavidus sp. RAF12 TaxID=3233050 RepID=UPI003F8E4297